MIRIRIRNPFKLVYVIDPYHASGYLFRGPYFIARWFCDKWADPRGMWFDTVETWAEVINKA